MTIKKSPNSVSPKPFHNAYRPDIDGLRAIAVIAVLIYHAFPHLLPSGFIGVDIFFVISGFLITSIILKQVDQGHFSILDFYGRRIRRIFPALLLVMLSVYVLGWRSLLASEYKMLGQHMAASAGFGANVMYWLESGYFDVASQQKPLLHLWSLGVEEQFYVFWPLFLILILKCRARPLIPMVVLALCSFVANVYLITIDPVQTFFLPHTRAWELAIGGIVSIFVKRREDLRGIDENGSSLSVNASNLLSVIGAIVVASAFILIRDEKQFPGWYGLLPTMGAACLIFAGKDSQLAKVLLSNRLMVAIGLISFPLYLWHWPLLSLLTILEVGKATNQMKLWMLALAVVLATLTYLLIEKPIRHTRSPAMVSAVLLILMMALAYLGYNTYSRDGLVFRASQFQAISKAQNEWEFPGQMKRGDLAGVSLFQQNSEGNATTLFIGDSNLEQYYPRAAQLIEENPKSNKIIFLSEGGCLPIPNTVSKQNTLCEGVANGVVKVLNSRTDIRKVVIAAQWYGYLFIENQNAKFVADGKEYPIGKDSEGYRKALSALADEIKMMKRRGLDVYLVLNIPIGLEFNPSYIAKRSIMSLWQGFSLRTGGRRLSEFESAFSKIKQDLIQLGHDSGAIVIDPTDTICRDDVCSSVDDDLTPKYKDDGHLRPTYVRRHIRFLDQTLE